MMLVTAFGHGGHDHTSADILEFHSPDGGLSWTPLGEAKVWQKNIGKCNVMSPALLRLKDGEILGFVMVKQAALEDCGPWVKRSTDNGKTWSEPVRLPYEGYGGAGNDRAIQISTGRVLLPCWVSMDKLGSTHAYCFYSDDRGKTWKKTALISTPKGTTGRGSDPAAEEPMVIELKDGRLMMIMRVYLKSIYVCYSDDQGATWNTPTSSGIPAPGSMSTIKRLPGGDILLIWNWAEVKNISGPWPRNFISSAVSTDDGENFSSVRHLDGATDFAGKITMANVVFSGDNAVITYSKSMTKKNAYNWRLQVIPIKWFYEGDMKQVYGRKFLPTLEAELKAAGTKPKTGPSLPADIPRPTADQRKQALEKMVEQVGRCKKEEDLIAAYCFDEGQGNFVFDVSKNANDLAIADGGDHPKWVDGKKGKALQFDGKKGFLLGPDSPSLKFDKNTFTFEAWVFPTAKKQYSLIASKYHAFEIGLLDGMLQAAVHSSQDGWGPGWLGYHPVPLEQWAHVIVTYDGQTLRFYQNGKLTDSASRRARMSTNKEPFSIGAVTHISDGGVFAGRIDEVRLYESVKYGSAVNPDPSRPPPKPRKVGRTHQLFLDDELIVSCDGLERIVNQPVKQLENPVLTWDRPWEGNCTITWGSVLWEPDEKLFKIWYEVYKKFPPPGEQDTMLCYATSSDGIRWDKPELNQVEFRGAKANNIILLAGRKEGFDAPSVFRDPHPTDKVKYRMYWHSFTSKGIRTATSPDGVHWNPIEGALVKAGDRCSAGYDAVRKKFYVITRIPGRALRTCGLWESDDGLKFEHAGEIAAPDDYDPAGTQFYGMITFPYAGMRLGFLEPFYVPTRKLNTQLMYSHDGHHWQRACQRQVFLQWGPPGSWDRTWVTPSQNPPIRVGDKLYIFYQGRQTLHWAEKPFGHIGSVGLATLRVDGFVSMESQWDEGAVTTQPLLLEGKTLHVNAKARPGTVRAEALDVKGKPIAGFTRDDCRPMSMTDGIDQPIGWKDNPTLDKLAARPVRLRFYVQGAKLYSFWIE